MVYGWKDFLREIVSAPAPNLITLTRVFLAVLICGWLIREEIWGWAFVCYLIAFSTDGLDGLTARSLHQVTRFGMMFDPLADKFLFLWTSYLLLPAEFHFWWKILLVLECGLIGIGFAALLSERVRKHLELGSNIWGKYKFAAFESSLVILLFLQKLGVDPFAAILLAAIGVTAMSILGHLRVFTLLERKFL